MRDAFEALRAFVRPPVTRSAEKCELCGASLRARHEHLLDPEQRAILCACPDCALVLSAREGSTWRRVRDRVERVAADLDDTDWASLGLPIDIAFFVHDGKRVVAMYPSPGGAITSTLPLDAWSALAAKNPVLARLEPHVEAFLVSRRGGAREHWLVSIDRCFALTGLVRRDWRGFTGGPALTSELQRFFARLEEESRA